MPERSPHEGEALAAVLSQLALDDLPESLHRAVLETLAWADRLGREAASRTDPAPRRPR